MKSNPIELIDDLKVIRTIHSNKARVYSRYNVWYSIITIVVAVVVTFIGFSGADNFAKLFNSKELAYMPDKKSNVPITNTKNINNQEKNGINFDNKNLIKEEQNFEFKDKVKMTVDLMTLSILVISILGLILQFEKKSNKHNTAVLRLSEFISDLEFNYKTKQPAPSLFNPDEVKIYAERYKSLIGALPATKDNDYFYALKTIKKKRKIKEYIEGTEYINDNPIKRKWKLIWI